MPRKKSVPVRREADRFHPDSLESRIVAEPAEYVVPVCDDEYGLLDNRDAQPLSDAVQETDVKEHKEWTPGHSVIGAYSARIDSKEIDACCEWKELGRKLLPNVNCPTVGCHETPKCFKLHHIANNTLALVCGSCKASLLTSRIGVGLWRALSLALQNESIRLQLRSTTQSESERTVSVLLHPSTTRLSSAVLNWALVGNTLSSAGASDWNSPVGRMAGSREDSIEQHFSAVQFLDSISQPQMLQSDNAASRVELSRRLLSLGVRTKLRNYQLQGVQWMHDQLTRSALSVPQTSAGESKSFSGSQECSTSTNTDSTTTDSYWQYHAMGWLQIPCTNAGSSTSTSASASAATSSSHTSATCWYNIDTEEIVHGKHPPTALQLPNSAILADEMGVGKSLQIISLALLLQHSLTALNAGTNNIDSTAYTADIAAPAQSEKSAATVQEANSLIVALAQQSAGEASATTDTNHSTLDSSASAVFGFSATAQGVGMTEPGVSNRACLCGSAVDLVSKTHRLLGWIQCACCNTWLHAPCAGFTDTHAMEQCGEYTCLACACLKHYAQPVTSRTTLIVMPNTLITQWKAELLKHVEKVTFNNPCAEGGLKVFVYPEEVGKKKGEDFARLDPRTLAQYDIVLLSFKALQKGYHDSNVDYTSERVLRSGYAIYPPAFLCVHYALLVVDETQNIESTTSQVLSMACRIPSAHRISVSGTPFGTGKLTDLYTLCQFLRVEPYASNRAAWLRIIEKPVVPVAAAVRLQWLRGLFQCLLLRRTKCMIAAKLGLPEHTMVTKPLQFSTFERALYEEKLGQYCNALLASSFATSIDMHDAKSKLEQLRRGCCHPQVLDKSLASKQQQRSAATSSSVITAGPRPLDEIMVAKVEQTRLSCEELQRGLLFNLFAMAGATILQAQCTTLHLTGYDNSTGSSASEAALSHPPAAWYLSQAQRIYTAALALIDRHRQSAVLVALAKLSGDEGLVYNDIKLSSLPAGSLLVPHSQEGLQLRWQLSSLPTPPPGMTTTSIRAIHSTSAAESSVQWRPFALPSAVLASMAAAFATTSSAATAVPMEGSCARLMFANSRRLVGCSAKNDVTRHVRRFCSHQQDLSSQSDRMHTGVRYQIVLMPAVAVLQAGLGSTDIYTNVHTVDVPLPSSCASASNGPSGQKSGAVVTTTTSDVAVQRSKKWQLCVKAVHSVCLVLRAEHNTSKGVVFTHTWAPLHVAAVLQKQRVQDVDSPSNYAVDTEMALDVCLYESSFDTDALQELHVCHNISTLPTLLQDPQQLAQYRIFTSSITPDFCAPLHTQAMIDFKTLKPGEAAACNAAAAVDSGAALQAVLCVQDGGVAVDADVDAAMEVIARRATVIEKEFLEAANSRRMVADCNLSELSAQVNDLDHEIGAEIRQVHHHGAHILGTSTTPDVVGDSGVGGASNSSISAIVKASAKDRAWWSELLTSLQDDTHFQASLQSCIDQGESAYRKLANFSSMYGLQYLLGREFDETEQARRAALKVLASLSKQPTAAEILESTDCQQCRAYFNKTGPICGHCKKQAYLKEYSTHILCFRRQNKRMVATSSSAAGAGPTKKKGKTTAKNGAGAANAQGSSAHILGNSSGDYESEEERVDFEVRSFDEGAVDGVLLMVLKQLRPHASHYTCGDLDDAEPSSVPSSDALHRPAGADAEHTYKELCALEIKRQECLKSELSAMMAAWERYSDLLKAHDELAQSKTRMSLALPATAVPSGGSVEAAWAAGAGGAAVGPSAGGKKPKGKAASLKEATDESSLLQLRPYELPASISKSYNAVLQADAELKRSLGSLQFYKEQVREIFAEQQPEGAEEALAHETSKLSSGPSAAVSNNDAAATSATGANDLPEERNAGVLTTPSKPRIQTCLFCREELQLGSTLHSPIIHRPPLPNAITAESAALTVSEEVVVLPCAHRYHRDCVTRWVHKHKACPLCKAKAAVSDFIAVAQYAVGPGGAIYADTPCTPAKATLTSPSAAAAQTQTPMKGTRSVEHRPVGLGNHLTGSAAISAGLEAGTGGNDAGTMGAMESADASSSFMQVAQPTTAAATQPLARHPQRGRLKGKWGTKVDALVMDLLELTLDADRLDEKAIVFSQWIEMVDIVSEALRANGIAYVKCANRSKDFTATGGVESFRTNSSLRVLVMPLALGAEGLDLIVASHVFLLEPLLNVHQELQAVNRISRLGQQRRTFVHKYVIANTIEERIVLIQNRSSGEDVKGIYSPSKGHKQRSDDDLLSERDLRFILGIQAHTVGDSTNAPHVGCDTIDLTDSVPFGVVDLTDQQRRAPTSSCAETRAVAAEMAVGRDDSSDTDSQVEGCEVMDLTSNLMEHFD